MVPAWLWDDLADMGEEPPMAIHDGGGGGGGSSLVDVVAVALMALVL